MPAYSLGPALPRAPSGIALTLAVLGTAGLAQPALADCGMGGHPGTPATLSVSGEGSVQVAPDRAMVTVGVSTRADTARQAMADNAERQQAVIDAVKGQGIEARDIQTSGLNLSPITADYPESGRSGAPTVSGYMAQNMVVIRIRALDRVGPVLDTLVSAGANEINGISFDREDGTAAMDQARRDAVADARRKAEVLADAAGVQLGPITALTEMGGGGGGPMMMRAMMDSAKGTPIEAGSLSMTAQVGVTYALVGDGPACPMMHGGPGEPMHHHPMGGPGRPTGGPGEPPAGPPGAPPVTGVPPAPGADGVPDARPPAPGPTPDARPPAPDTAPVAAPGAEPPAPDAGSDMGPGMGRGGDIPPQPPAPVKN